MTLSQTVKKRIEDDMVVISIDNPPVNALSLQVLEDLEKIFDELDRDDQVKGVVITGTGTNFSAGADIKAFSSASPDDAISISKIGQRVFNRIERFDRPVIAAVNGVAMGGGFEIALACDLIVASENAVFALPEPKVGLAALAGGLNRLPRQIGTKRALGMILTGRHVSAIDGEKLGFVNEVVPSDELMSRAYELANEIIACSPLSIRASKDAVYRSLDFASLEESMKDMRTNYAAIKAMINSEDFIEGPKAFAEKRPPNWKGK